MKSRMLCTDCGALEYSDTLLEGSDLVEMLGWLCLAVPGWIYCWWRHALRRKVCPDCGSDALVREARAAAAAAASEVDEALLPRVGNLEGPMRWPLALATPRARMRRGLIGVVAWAGCALAWSLGSGLLPVGLLALAGSCWLAHQTIPVVRRNATLVACRAWDGDGRPLRIEAA